MKAEEASSDLERLRALFAAERSANFPEFTDVYVHVSPTWARPGALFFVGSLTHGRGERPRLGDGPLPSRVRRLCLFGAAAHVVGDDLLELRRPRALRGLRSDLGAEVIFPSTVHK